MKIASTVILAFIIAALAGSAFADDSSPTSPTVSTTTPAQPAAVDPSDAPALPEISVPDGQSVAPAFAPTPGVQVKAMLLNRLRTQIVLYRNKTRRLQGLLGQRLSPGGNIWNLGTPQTGKKTLQAWQSRVRKLIPAAKLRVQKDMRAVAYMLQVMGQRLPVRTLAVRGSLLQQLEQTNQRLRVTYHQYVHPPHLAQLMCIHHGEGSWTDSGAPFWGGLQMDYTFQSGYGGFLLHSKGTADHWTPLEQIWTAEKAVPSRGFHPWPNTGRACGLIK